MLHVSFHSCSVLDYNEYGNLFLFAYAIMMSNSMNYAKIIYYITTKDYGVYNILPNLFTRCEMYLLKGV